MRILGVDIGTYSIKAVEIDAAFGRYEIREYHEHPVEMNPEGTGAQIALAKLMQALPKPPERVVLCLRTKEVTFRNLDLPTRDKKAIQAAIGFELEDDLPFPFEQAVFDYSVMQGPNKRATIVHVAVTLRRYLSEALARLADSGVDPDVVTTEASAFRVFLNRVLSPEAQERPVMIVQIGETRTVTYIHWKGAPVVCREFAWGGRDLTHALAKKYQVPIPQAEQTKLDHGFVIPPSQRLEATQEQIDFSDALLEPVQQLAWNLRQAKVTCKSHTQHNLNQVYLTGGTSSLPGLMRVLEESLDLPVQPLQALSSVATSGVTYSEHADAAFLTASSLALSQVGPDRGTIISFRKGEFSKQGKSRELNYANLRRPLIAVAAIAASLLLSLVSQSFYYHKQMTDADTRLERSVKTFFGGALSASATRNYLASISSLKSNVNKELTRKRDLAKLMAPNPHSPLDFLKELSNTVPRDVVVDLMQYQVGAATTSPYSATDSGDASLTFLIQNPQTADRLNSILSSQMKDLTKGKLEESVGSDDSEKDGAPAGRRWKITFTGKPLETAYGK